MVVFFGFQNFFLIEDDIGFVEIFYMFGVWFMQLIYNNQLLFVIGCYEVEDMGIICMGKQVIKEMNCVGLVIDMSYFVDCFMIEVVEIFECFIVIIYVNLYVWYLVLCNKCDDVICVVIENGGMIGFFVYLYYLKGKIDCIFEDFCEMIVCMVDKFGVEYLGIGIDLCQD